MTAESGEVPGTPGHRTRGRPVRLVAFGIALALLCALVAGWSQRRQIASGYIDRAFAALHVPARYRIADLGFGRQRLTNVVLGDPAQPDLVADWVEIETHVGLSGVGVAGLRAGRVRMRAQLINGRVSLGALDRLLPAPSGKPFALPAIDADVSDARLRLETPQGVVGLKLSGRGRLDDGFRGQLAAVSDWLGGSGCATTGVRAALKIAVAKGAPSVSGPVWIAEGACGGVALAEARADVTLALSAALDRWQGKARLAVTSVTHPAARVAALAGTISFDKSATRMAGAVDLRSGPVRTRDLTAAGVRVAGDYVVARSGSAFTGQVGATEAALTPARLAPVARLASTGQGTPIGPVVAQLARAGIAAGRAFRFDGAVSAAMNGGNGKVFMSQAKLASASGARIALDAGQVVYAWPSGAVQLAGRLGVSGGGLPRGDIAFTQVAPGAPLVGAATFAPYAAGTARVALTPVRFTASPHGNSRVQTQVTLSGPLGEGRVESLRLALDGLWNGRDTLALNPDCAALGFDRLALSGLVLRATTLPLCPLGGALLTMSNGTLAGGVRMAAPRLAGLLGTTPIALAARGAELRLADTGFALKGMGVRVGRAERVTRLDFAALDGRLAGSKIAGSFAGGAGQIANVPLLLSAAAGQWEFARGKLGLIGALTVSDASASPRFNPLAARSVALGIANGTIRVAGTLFEPTKSVKVADIAIAHDLVRGSGAATITVPGITFGQDLQPDLLTRLTFGVIADVAGTIDGAGHIAWSPSGVTSDGAFHTADIDLAAAFGPVSGIAGTIAFTDLLNLQSAPGQVFTVKTLNPGIPVNDGTIRFQTLPGALIRVESGLWPFAGGTLALDPTLLDFAEAGQRRMTFRVRSMDAGLFLQQFDFKNLDATGVFDGSLPMIFDQSGGRIKGGKLTVRAGGGTVAYVGELSQKDLGFWGNVAFQALKSLRYRNLSIAMDGPLAGEMITQVQFAGVGQGKGAKRNFLVSRLVRLPLVFNVQIKAPFRGLIDSAASFYDPSRLIQRNLPALIEEQRRRAAPRPPAQPPAIQPPASRTVP